MIKDGNNNIINDVLASFAIDFISVPDSIVEKVKANLNLMKDEEKKLILKNEEKF